MALDIKLGAPETIEGGANRKATISVQNMMQLKELTLADGATEEGSIVTAGRLLGQANEEGDLQDNFKVVVEQSGTTHVDAETIDNLASGLDKFTADSSMSGSLTADLAYEDSVSALMARFPELTIEAAKYYIRFADPEVLRVLLANGVGDGTGVTTEQAKAYTGNMPSWFQGLTITGFEELKYFGTTNLYWTFSRATVGKINFDNITIMTRTFFQSYILEPVMFFKNLYEIGGYTFQVSGAPNGILKLFMPKVRVVKDSGIRGCGAEIIDIKTLETCGPSNFASIVGSLVIRDTEKVVYTDVSNNMKKYFVPSNIVEDYKASETYSTYASKIFAIGGPEWVAEFGSADPYADVMKYAPDQYDEIVEAYENA